MEKKNVIAVFVVLGLSILFLIIFFTVFTKKTKNVNCTYVLGYDYPIITTDVDAEFSNDKISACTLTNVYEFENVNQAKKYYEGIKAPHISLDGNKVIIIQDCLDYYKQKDEYKNYNNFINSYTNKYYICK